MKKGICRTALATPGSVNNVEFFFFQSGQIQVFKRQLYTCLQSKVVLLLLNKIYIVVSNRVGKKNIRDFFSIQYHKYEN